MTTAFAIALGGAVGALLRYWASAWVGTHGGTGLPLGILTVNAVGSLAIGVLFVLFVERGSVSPELRLGLMTGLLGALTTFSTFSLDTLLLLESGRIGTAIANVAASVVLCIGGAWAGMSLARAGAPA